MAVMTFEPKPMQVLYSAYIEHKRKYQGLPPKRFELHPEVVRSIKREAKMPHCWDLAQDRPKIFGVELVETTEATRPKLISCTNEVEYI